MLRGQVPSPRANPGDFTNWHYPGDILKAHEAWISSGKSNKSMKGMKQRICKNIPATKCITFLLAMIKHRSIKGSKGLFELTFQRVWNPWWGKHGGRIPQSGSEERCVLVLNLHITCILSLILRVGVCIFVCAQSCRCPRRLKEGVRSGAGVTGSCGPPDWSVRKLTRVLWETKSS